MHAKLVMQVWMQHKCPQSSARIAASPQIGHSFVTSTHAINETGIAWASHWQIKRAA